MTTNFEQEIREAQDANLYKRKYQDLQSVYEMRGDFIEWLFETELDYTSLSEMWEKFDKLLETQPHEKPD